MIRVPVPGFAVLYRWRLHPGTERAFTDAWSRTTELLRAERGALGSRLHRGVDGTWYAYAQWPSARAREQSFALGPVDPAALQAMNEAIAERLPEVTLEPIADLLAETSTASAGHLLHHVSLGVADIRRAAGFYDAALAPLGQVRVWQTIEAAEGGPAVGYGPPDGDDVLALKVAPASPSPGPGSHLALAAPDRDAVDHFHAAALAHGGRDNGAPGLRPHYGEHYYAAFVIDPDGHRLEAVVSRPMQATRPRPRRTSRRTGSRLPADR